MVCRIDLQFCVQETQVLYGKKLFLLSLTRGSRRVLFTLSPGVFSFRYINETV